MSELASELLTKPVTTHHRDAERTVSKHRRRILMLLPFPPRFDATHGGGRVLAQVIAGLAERNRVAVIYFRLPDEPPIDDVLGSLCDRVEEVPRCPTRPQSGARWRRRARWLNGLAAGAIRGAPVWAKLYSSVEFGTRVRSVVDEWHPDVVQIEFHVLGQYADALHLLNVPTILVQHEPGILAAKDALEISGFLRRQVVRLEVFAWRRFERHVMRDVDAVVTFTERDRRALLSLSKTVPIVTIPLGVPIPAEPLSPTGYGSPTLLFVGNFRHPPNVHAALRLAFDIFPSVRSEVPYARLCIVGDQPPAQVQELDESSGVTVTGRVPDITPYLDQAAAIVVPIRSGGGMRVKVLEALAAGKAVIASRKALEGLCVEDRYQVIVAETDEEFVRESIRLLRDQDARESVARRAREWSDVNLGWESSISAYEALYSRVAVQRRNLTTS